MRIRTIVLPCSLLRALAACGSSNSNADSGPDATTDTGTSDAATDTGTSDAATDASADSGSGAAFGGRCTANADCATGLCWDFSDYDMFCGGKICSDMCTTDTDCQDKASAAGASSPADAQCLSDGTCDLVGAGIGAFFCA